MTIAKVTQQVTEVGFVRNSTSTAKVTQQAVEVGFQRTVVTSAKVSTQAVEVGFERATTTNARVSQQYIEVGFVEATVALGPVGVFNFQGQIALVTTENDAIAIGPEAIFNFTGQQSYAVTTDLDGFLVTGFFEGTDFTYISTSLDNYLVDYYPPHFTVLGTTIFGSYVDNNPTVEPLGTAPAAVIANFFSNDFYNRIHIYPNPLDLGKVLTSVTDEITVWNSYLETSQILNGISGVNDAGITATALGLPKTIAPLEEYGISFTAIATGQSLINATYTLDFASQDLTVTVKGTRATLIQYPYLYEFNEDHEWVTDVIPTYNTEERIFIREIRRTTLSITCILPSIDELTRARVLFQNLEHEPLALPIWENIFVTGALSSGTSVIPTSVHTKYLELIVGDSLVIRGGLNNFELVIVASFTDYSITLTTPTVNSYTSTCIAPVKIGRIVGGATIDQSNNKLRLNFNFLILESYQLSDWPNIETFKSLPVIADKRAMLGKTDEKFQREVSLFDNKTGKYANPADELYTKLKGIITFTAHTREDKYWVKRKLDYLKGRFQVFWFASAQDDIIPLSDIGSGTSLLEIRTIGWSTYPPKNIRVTGLTTTGLPIIQNFTVQSVTLDLLDSTKEKLFFLETASTTIQNISKVEILWKIRLNSDRYSLEHKTKETMLVSIPTTEVD